MGGIVQPRLSIRTRMLKTHGTRRMGRRLDTVFVEIGESTRVLSVGGKENALVTNNTHFTHFSEVVLALRAPTTTKCDLCQVSFCGINVQSRCSALPLMQQHPHDLSDVGDLIQSSEIYDCFDGNTVEVDYMLDHLTAQRLTPRHVYREVSFFII